ncbi:MAG: protein kinase family protein [Eggerthellaceae bacterium]
MNAGEKVLFGASKTLSYVRPLGAGGTGTVFLFHDDIADQLFAIKKFEPKGGNELEDSFDRFIGEVKISLRLNHPNIVRVYDYFLYPNQRTGYLMMEYIEGVSIDRCEPVQMGESWNKIFEEAISAFRNIESLGMLHRDVRPNNFLIDNEGSLKVIDFGFGKQLTENSTEGTSIFLNWPASNPDEVLEGRYTHASEIY